MIRFTLQRYNFFSKCVTFVARFYHVKKKYKNMCKKMKQNHVYFTSLIYDYLLPVGVLVQGRKVDIWEIAV